MPEERPRLVWLLGTSAAILGVSMERDLLCLTSDMLLQVARPFFWVLIYLFCVGWGKAELEELYLPPVCPSEPRSLAPLQLCAATVASVTAVTAACDSTPGSGQPRET